MPTSCARALLDHRYSQCLHLCSAATPCVMLPASPRACGELRLRLQDGPGDEPSAKGHPRKKAKHASGSAPAPAAAGGAGSDSSSGGSSSSSSSEGDKLSDVELDNEEDVFCDKAPEIDHKHKAGPLLKLLPAGAPAAGSAQSGCS